MIFSPVTGMPYVPPHSIDDSTYRASLLWFADHKMPEFLDILEKRAPELDHRPTVLIYLSNPFACECLAKYLQEHVVKPYELDDTLTFAMRRLLPKNSRNPTIPLIKLVACRQMVRGIPETDINVIALQDHDDSVFADLMTTHLVEEKQAWYFLVCNGDQSSMPSWKELCDAVLKV